MNTNSPATDKHTFPSPRAAWGRVREGGHTSVDFPTRPSSLQPPASSLPSTFPAPRAVWGRVREGGHASVDFPTRPSSLQPPASSLRTRPAFTLTELLVVIVIIGMLAGISLGALYNARETARVQRTKATITKLDRIIQAKYAEFQTRRLPITNRRIPPRVMAELKLQVLREIIRMEMPDRLNDITYPRASGGTGQTMDEIGETFTVSLSTPNPLVQETLARTAKARSIYRRVAGNDAFYAPTDPNYATAECLYLIVTSDPEARDQFQPNEIGDVDGDGVPEFLDGWGMPIRFIRWAPVLRSEMQSGDPENDHDPFDPRRVDPLAFRLVPYIYSAGPDNEYGVSHDDTDGWSFQYGSLDPFDDPVTDVSRLYDMTGQAGHIGVLESDTHYDNITNHSLGMN